MLQANNSTSQNYSGIYTQKEKFWLTVLRYGGFVLFGTGIYGFVTSRFHAAVSVAAIITAIILTTINVRIMQVGIARRKEMDKKQVRKGRRAQ